MGDTYQNYTEVDHIHFHGFYIGNFPTLEEEKMKTLARRSIFVLQDIEKNESFTSENIGLRRPGNGISPKYFETIIGKKSTKNILKGRLLQEGDYDD